MYVLDTDVCVFLLRGRASGVAARLRQSNADEIAVTAITAAELRYGAVHSGNPPRNLEQVERFLAPLEILPFDSLAASHFAAIKQHLASTGNVIGPMDLLIAATSRANAATLATNNTREFTRVPGLLVENWCEAQSG
jgi:tRNA(fMet)-specific endonuclease VapC